MDGSNLYIVGIIKQLLDGDCYHSSVQLDFTTWRRMQRDLTQEGNHTNNVGHEIHNCIPATVTHCVLDRPILKENNNTQLLHEL